MIKFLLFGGSYKLLKKLFRSINKLTSTTTKAKSNQVKYNSAESISDDFDAEMIKLDRVLAEQDKQIAAVNKANAEYKKTKDIQSYASFWDGIMASGGLKFNGRKWEFEPIRVFIRAGRHDDAWRLLNIKGLKSPADFQVYKLRSRILKKEKRYQALIQEVVKFYGYETVLYKRFDRASFEDEMKPICKKVSDKLSVDRLAEIVEITTRNNRFTYGDAHSLLKNYYIEIGLLDKNWGKPKAKT